LFIQHEVSGVLLHYEHEVGTVTSPPAAPPGDYEPTALLVDRIQAGDHPTESFEKLFRRYQPRVFGILMRRGCEKRDCDDITQKTFLRVYHSIGSLRDAPGFEKWLDATTINVFRDEIKKRRRRCEVPLVEVGDESDGDRALVSPLPSPFEEASAQELEDALCHAIAKLSKRKRQCLNLRWLHGLSHKEIGRIMKITTGAVSAHLHQARERLANVLQGGGPPPPKGRS
jgi:RNA polymerase sigma factor (sigma-70 family)